jgi:hypothetical protein
MKNKRKKWIYYSNSICGTDSTGELRFEKTQRNQIHKGGEENQSKAESKMRVKGERCREGRGRGQRRLMADTLGLENNVFILFFFKCWLVEPVRFDSVQSVSNFRNRNQTEPESFCDFLIG